MRRIVWCLSVLLLLAGCDVVPFARELEDTMLVQVLGVDWAEREITLTAASDPGTGGAGAGTALLSASGTDLEAAKAALKGAGEEYVSLTHVTQLVLGADSDLCSVLEAALKEPALGQGATVWLAAEGSAKDLLEGAGGGAKRLSSIELNSGVKPVTVLQSLMRLEEERRVELPLLGLEGDTLVPVGTKIIWEERDGA